MIEIDSRKTLLFTESYLPSFHRELRTGGGAIKLDVLYLYKICNIQRGET